LGVSVQVETQSRKGMAGENPSLWHRHGCDHWEAPEQLTMPMVRSSSGGQAQQNKASFSGTG